MASKEMIQSSIHYILWFQVSSCMVPKVLLTTSVGCYKSAPHIMLMMMIPFPPYHWEDRPHGSRDDTIEKFKCPLLAPLVSHT